MKEWERKTGESYPAYEAFRLYLTEPTLMKRWARKYRWRERANS